MEGNFDSVSDHFPMFSPVLSSTWRNCSILTAICGLKHPEKVVISSIPMMISSSFPLSSFSWAGINSISPEAPFFLFLIYVNCNLTKDVCLMKSAVKLDLREREGSESWQRSLCAFRTSDLSLFPFFLTSFFAQRRIMVEIGSKRHASRRGKKATIMWAFIMSIHRNTFQDYRSRDEYRHQYNLITIQLSAQWEMITVEFT